MNFKNMSPILLAFAAGLICLVVYLPVCNSDFINYDDTLFVTDNPAIRIIDFDFFKWAFTTSYQGWWMPLIWISFAIDYHIWGLNPLGYHLTNILLHAFNVGLVVLVADRIFKQGVFQESSANGQSVEAKWEHLATILLVGLLWGLHPINVESVAWVVERKNVLNGIFSLNCVLFYLGYLKKKDTSVERGEYYRDYIFSVLFLLLALMTKPVSVVIPVVLLVLDLYPLGRLQKFNLMPIITEKIPYLLLSGLVAISTVLLASGQSIIVPLDTYPLFSRCISSGAALFDYCLLMLYPVEIVAMYLIPSPLPTSYYVKTAIVVCFTVFCLYSFAKKPWLTATWLCFLLPILPTLHFFINGAHSVCSHFAYLPSIAPSFAAAAIISHTYKKSISAPRKWSRILITVGIAALFFFYVAMTERLIGSWKNPETLWTRVINLRPVGRAYYYRADYYITVGKYLEAAEDLRISIQMANSAGYPDVFNLQALRGDALSKIGQHKAAMDEFTAAIRSYPHPSYYFHRGRALEALGMMPEAAEDYKKAGDEKGPIVKRNRD